MMLVKASHAMGDEVLGGSIAEGAMMGAAGNGGRRGRRDGGYSELPC